MQTVLVEVNSETGLHLLRDLELLNVLRIVKENVVETKVKFSDKYKGVFTKEDAQSMDNHIDNMRGEWDNI